ncbi:hypothetical protein BDV29DRAFT_170846, partial [Aspergillus leporis]
MDPDADLPGFTSHALELLLATIITIIFVELIRRALIYLDLRFHQRPARPREPIDFRIIHV